MNVVIIPEILNKKSYDWFCNELSIIESNFLLDRNLFDDIDDIDKYNKTLVSYIVYQIILNSDLEPKCLETPNGGLGFRNKIGKSFDTPLGIYHAHLENDMVLIWYLEKRFDDELYLVIDYIKHPNDYKDNLIKIFKTDFGFNILTMNFFKNYKNNTYLKENKFILIFKNFLK